MLQGQTRVCDGPGANCGIEDFDHEARMNRIVQETQIFDVKSIFNVIDDLNS